MAETIVTASPTEPTITISRWFDAPRRLVYDAMTKPELVKRWWGFRDDELVVCEIDHRVGGRWRFVLRHPDGREDGFGGVYKEIVPNLRVVQTFIYDPYPDAEAVETAILVEENRGTTLSILVRHKTMEARDGHLGAGMERGLKITHERLAELLAHLRATQ